MTHAQIKSEMQSLLSPKRYAHTLAVAEEVEALCEIFEIEDKDALVTSALLHDCTKPLTYDEHIALAKNVGLVLTQDDLMSPEVLHSRTGSVMAEKRYKARGREIYSHTTGKADMTLSEKILFLADYIEKTRTHEVCIKTRQEFYSSLREKNTTSEKIRTLDETLLRVLENTASYLNEKKAFIHSDTYLAIDFLKEELNGTK